MARRLFHLPFVGTTLNDPKHIIERGYDQLGSSYRAFFEKSGSERYSDWLTDFVQRLPPQSNVLELGCADGIPTARYLSQHTHYQGIDLSANQVELARRNVPEAQFKVADMASLSYPDGSFEGIVALYSIIHLPLAEQPLLFESVYKWLKPSGYFLCVLGADNWTGTEANWITPGTLMYWSHTDAATYQGWFTDIGFTILTSSFVAEGNGGHTLFLLTK